MDRLLLSSAATTLQGGDESVEAAILVCHLGDGAGGDFVDCGFDVVSTVAGIEGDRGPALWYLARTARMVAYIDRGVGLKVY